MIMKESQTLVTKTIRKNRCEYPYHKDQIPGGTHQRGLSVSHLMNPNMTGFG